ncbi:hypothetical protein GCM10009535_45590 [Streptomyces thermocarboxydovorans]|uniref:Urease alpha-subunit N-terminal domain-containing protein n=1 Tax=Streptomyces thermocarboxydovorans TaxID=59298 RepID=A0ABN1HNY8_9ACTN
MPEISRAAYADRSGPTTGDRIRLADTDLLVEIEEDRSGGPGRAGDEAVFGGGKVIRESRHRRRPLPGPADGAVAGRRHQRHLHPRGRRVPAPAGREGWPDG